MAPIRLIILGATGSIGQNARAVLEEHRDKIQVEGLVARSRFEAVHDFALAFDARWVGLTDPAAADRLRQFAPDRPYRLITGMEAIVETIHESSATTVLAAMSGFSGLRPTLAALERGMTVLLANKETLVAAGDLVKEVAAAHAAALVPVDSEHSAIFQCLGLDQPIRRIILTCSGGPFRGMTREKLRHVTVEQALAHPNWRMGPKITVDSATLMNKGLEIIEAHHLFNTPFDQIDVVVHPESVIHSLVEFVDGATLAQLGWPDMRVPIQVALSWPDRWPLSGAPLSLTDRPLTFMPPDEEAFPALRLARQAGIAGGLYPTVLNAANEEAVAAFLARDIAFLDISRVVEHTLSAFSDTRPAATLEDILATDRWARQTAAAWIHERARTP
ncbi:MAG: 1-deoxy-D-xylulose-5-phosphate reductoisomerase [Sulfobacillus sp.]|nr:1-deoxy-D-xylulose-5-phosphate reductoisomerase [Sulfobacillus sp.]